MRKWLKEMLETLRYHWQLSHCKAGRHRMVAVETEDMVIAPLQKNRRNQQRRIVGAQVTRVCTVCGHTETVQEFKSNTARNSWMRATNGLSI
ncbi:hypothetical protein [Delftia phage PhiW-14]|uniref:Uncharacterized protein n=1 Tax=Delftia phage PhiW-14 TaxID=665032 RepID=C9DGH0_BPW14|nr:hypothetical protein DP-phiW-14_gp200 [Delftia phage PhiW-14]ACV50221.1 hypothetical protein [Delftia phage PhiW-14]